MTTRGSEGFRNSRFAASLVGQYRKEGLRKRKQRLEGRCRLLNSVVGVRGFEPPASTSRIMSTKSRHQRECGPQQIFQASTTLCTTHSAGRRTKVTNTRPFAVTIIRRTPSASQSRENLSGRLHILVAKPPCSAYPLFLVRLLPRASCTCVSVYSCLVYNVDNRLPTEAM